VRIVIDARRLEGSVVRPHPALPQDTRLWAAMQQAGGGTWGGCVYDVDQIVERLTQHKDTKTTK
jgi:hypothetical protein